MEDLAMHRYNHQEYESYQSGDKFFKMDELLPAYKSMFEGPARDAAKSFTTFAIRRRARAVLLRWINGFRVRKQLNAAASEAGLKRKREDAVAASALEGGDYGFAF